MPGITINTTFTGGASLPSALSRQEQILALPGLLMWAQADAAHITLAAGGIGTFRDVAGGDGVFTAANADKATLDPATLGDYAVSTHVGADATRYNGSGFTLAADEPYSYVAVFKPGDTSVDRSVIGRLSSATSRASLSVATGSGYGRLYHGSGTHFFSLNPAIWSVVGVSFDGTDLRAYCNGAYTTPTTAAGTTGSNTMTLAGYNDAAAFDGMIADAMVFGSDIVGNGDIELIAAHFASLYSIP